MLLLSQARNNIERLLALGTYYCYLDSSGMPRDPFLYRQLLPSFYYLLTHTMRVYCSGHSI